MVDKVVVTLTYGNREFDMEFPAKAPVEQIKPLLIQALQYKGVLLAEPFHLVCNGYVLKNSDTFLESGVWDGCYLELIYGGQQS